MKRRNFIKVATGAGLAAASASLTGVSAAHAKKKHRWRIVMAVPKTLPIWGPEVVQFAEDVKQLSGGRLSIRVYGAGELVPALGVFDAVKKGEVQMGHAASYYWVGKVPASPYFCAVPFGMSIRAMKAWLQEGGGQQLWDELYGEHGLVGMPCGNTGIQMGGWFKKEIKTLADFKGLKMRMPGLGSKVIAKAGAKPVLVAGGEIYTNLTTGVIDATEWVGPYHDYTMGFHKAAKFYYYPGWHEPGAQLELMINKTAWQQLDADLQKVVKICAEATDRRMNAMWAAKDSEYYHKLKKLGTVQFRAFPKPVLTEMKKFADEVMAEVAETNSLTKKIHQSYYSFKNSYDEYQKLTDIAYANI